MAQESQNINERWQQIDSVFQAAVELEAEGRAAYLDDACSGDQLLRQKVESMLACDDRGWQLIEKSAVEVAAPLLSAEEPQLTPGQAFGHYDRKTDWQRRHGRGQSGHSSTGKRLELNC